MYHKVAPLELSRKRESQTLQRKLQISKNNNLDGQRPSELVVTQL